MTAVAPPVTLQPSTRPGWTSNGNGFGAMNSDDVGRMFNPGSRRPVQRSNSSSSSSSASSNGSTCTNVAAGTPVPSSMIHLNYATGTAPETGGNWLPRKKPTRVVWPSHKSEPATGISTARPQTVSAVSSGPTASSAMSALHAPILPSQPMASGPVSTNNAMRSSHAHPEPQSAILHLLPINGTFERKTITVPYFPDVLRVGRQTNQKTIPTPSNGYFDSKVLSRQHAEIYADRQGRIFIRDVKSSNGTFVNGMRLSQENKESEPRELREQDVLELGIDIVSEDQKTVVHHKVAAKVEHAGIYGQGSDALNFSDLDPSTGSGLMPGGPHQLKRAGSHGSLSSRGMPPPGLHQPAPGMGFFMQQPPNARSWLNPVSTEHIMKKLNAELKLAMQQSKDLARARESIEAMLGGKVELPTKDSKSGSEKARPSPIKSKSDIETHFSEPPAPPPSAPLPEKPDVARALADPVIQPLLRRSDTTRPPSTTSSPTKTDHSSDILRLCEELKLAKGELSNQSERMKSLEDELAHERTARESAEERAQQLEQAERRDSPRDNVSHDITQAEPTSKDATLDSPPDLQAQLDRLRTTMDEMKQHMESYRQRAESAEKERDNVRQSLAEMVEDRRKMNAERSSVPSPKRSHSPRKRTPPPESVASASASNGHVVSPAPLSPTSDMMLERAGVEEGRPITTEQAKILTKFLAQEVLNSAEPDGESTLLFHGRPVAYGTAVVLFGVVAMVYMNAWSRLER